MERMTAQQFNQKYPTYFKKTNRGSKYNAKKVLLDNKKFDSTSEGDYYCQLQIQKKAGLIKDVECQKKEEFWAYGKHICDYYVDFLVHHNDGRLEYIEHKSAGTVKPEWRIKWKLLLAKYADEIQKGEIICSINWYAAKYKFIPKI